jgi:ribosomal protein L12E/L44/L45/RPP1/RPP2
LENKKAGERKRTENEGKKERKREEEKEKEDGGNLVRIFMWREALIQVIHSQQLIN